MIRVTNDIFIQDDELDERFIRSSGPGGQNVNKVSTAVQLRFDVARCATLPDSVRRRLVRLAGGRINAQGVLIVNAQRHRSQQRNRQDARDRLLDLIRHAAQPPKKRHKRSPSLAAKRRRLEDKLHRSRVKQLRRSKHHDES